MAKKPSHVGGCGSSDFFDASSRNTSAAPRASPTRANKTPSRTSASSCSRGERKPDDSPGLLNACRKSAAPARGSPSSSSHAANSFLNAELPSSSWSALVPNTIAASRSMPRSHKARASDNDPSRSCRSFFTCRAVRTTPRNWPITAGAPALCAIGCCPRMANIANAPTLAGGS